MLKKELVIIGNFIDGLEADEESLLELVDFVAKHLSLNRQGLVTLI